MTSAYAPYLETYGTAEPYITATEYINAPTALDLSNLVTGNRAAQVTALTEVIGRASSWIDGYVTGAAYNTLCATSNVENARIWGNRMGQLIVHPKLWPCLEVQAFSYSTSPTSAGASITPAGNIWIEPQQFIVQPSGVVNLGLTGAAGIGTMEYYCTWQYVNGFPNTTLSASIAAGAYSASVVNALGIYPSSVLTLFDAPNDEQVQISADYVPGSSTLLFTNPVSYAHASGTTITNIPKAVKQAAICATSALIKERGSGGFTVQDINTGVEPVPANNTQGSTSDWQIAKDMLDKMRQMFIGY